MFTLYSRSLQDHVDRDSRDRDSYCFYLDSLESTSNECKTLSSRLECHDFRSKNAS